MNRATQISSGIAEAYFARNLIHAVFGEPLFTRTYISEDGYSKRSLEEKFFEEFEETNAHLLVLYPNPTEDVVWAKYRLPLGTERAVIAIYARNGPLLQTVQVRGEQGEIALNLASYSAGIYVCVLNADGKVIARRKLMVTGH